MLFGLETFFLHGFISKHFGVFSLVEFFIFKYSYLWVNIHLIVQIVVFFRVEALSLASSSSNTGRELDTR